MLYLLAICYIYWPLGTLCDKFVDFLLVLVCFGIENLATLVPSLLPPFFCLKFFGQVFSISWFPWDAILVPHSFSVLFLCSPILGRIISADGQD
jgi:hypothetical protein